MKNITLNTANEKVRIFVAEDNETVEQILGHQDVIDWLNNNTNDETIENSGDVVKHMSAYCGAVVPEVLLPCILSAQPDDGTSIEFDLSVNSEWEEETHEAPQQPEQPQTKAVPEAEAAATQASTIRGTTLPKTGTEGIITISLSGGLHIIHMRITNGVTTVHNAVYSTDVRTRSGMTDTQISNCAIEYNGFKMDERAMRGKTVYNGDVITMVAHVASDKG